MTDEEAEEQEKEYEKAERKSKRQIATLSHRLIHEVDHDPVYIGVLDAIINHEAEDLAPFRRTGRIVNCPSFCSTGFTG